VEVRPERNRSDDPEAVFGCSAYGDGRSAATLRGYMKKRGLTRREVSWRILGTRFQIKLRPDQSW